MIKCILLVCTENRFILFQVEMRALPIPVKMAANVKVLMMEKTLDVSVLKTALEKHAVTAMVIINACFLAWIVRFCKFIVS